MTAIIMNNEFIKYLELRNKFNTTKHMVKATYYKLQTGAK